MKIKGLREVLCKAQAEQDDWPLAVQLNVQLLIQQIDGHRPLGPDGSHGELHTATCGCEDK